MLRTISELAQEIQRDAYLCFIDYNKEFGKMNHDNIMYLLETIDIVGKDLRIIKNIYREQTAAVRLKNEISNYQPIKRGVRQGCFLSPDLFLLHSEYIRRIPKASWTAKKISKGILKEVDTKLNLFDRIRTYQVKFVSRVMR